MRRYGWNGTQFSVGDRVQLTDEAVEILCKRDGLDPGNVYKSTGEVIDVGRWLEVHWENTDSTTVYQPDWHELSPDKAGE